MPSPASAEPPSDPTGPRSAPDASAGEALALSWQWPRGMLGLSIANFLLRLLTLGIYHFWGKTEVRRRIWSAIRLNGEPLTYTGTGGELFIGFVIVSLVVFLPITLATIGLMFAFGPDSTIAQVVPGLVYVPILFLVGVAIYRATRYRLARTRWRGIRGALSGHSGHYGWTFFWTMMVAALTLGWAVPWRSTKLQAMQISNMRFGNRPMRFTATSGPLYIAYSVIWFGTIAAYVGAGAVIWRLVGDNFLQSQVTGVPVPPTTAQSAWAVLTLFTMFLFILIIGAWYRARVFNHFANHTHFEDATFSGTVTAGGLIWIAATNLLLAFVGVALLAVPVGLAARAALSWLGPLSDDPELQVAIIQVVPLLALFVIGLGYTLLSPLAQARLTGYLVRHLAITGTAPLALIEQASGGDAKFGEGLAQAFDVDAF